jgi:choline dehydrogenase-like flavoprotein
MHVQPALGPHPFFDSLLEAAESAGMRRFENANGRMMEADGGCAVVDEIVKDGRRQSVFRSYVYSRMDQANLTVLTGALVTRVVFKRNRAAGVEVLCDGKLRRFEAALEVVVSLGAIQTPKLLMQSGVGDQAELAKFGIPVVADLPGVGRNLHDHAALGCVWDATEQPLPRAPRTSVRFRTSKIGLLLTAIQPRPGRPRNANPAAPADQASGPASASVGKHRGNAVRQRRQVLRRQSAARGPDHIQKHDMCWRQPVL